MSRAFILIITCNVLKTVRKSSFFVIVGLFSAGFSLRAFSFETTKVVEFLAVFSGECDVLPSIKVDISSVDSTVIKTDPEYVTYITRDPNPGCNRNGSSFLPNHFETPKRFAECLNLNKTNCPKPNESYSFRGSTSQDYLKPYVRLRIQFEKQAFGILNVNVKKISSASENISKTLQNSSVHSSFIGLVKNDEQGYAEVSKSFLNVFMNSDLNQVILNIAVYTSTDAFYMRELIRDLGLPVDASKFDL